MTQTVYLFTDGACKGNPGIGGWGALLRYKQHEKELFGGQIHTTNNRMELQAVIEGLQALKYPCHVVVYTDSKYVQQGMQSWLSNWKKNGWLTSNKQAIKNQDLWQRLDELVSQHTVEWMWVKGHAGHDDNERADRLANLGVAQIQGQQ